MQISLIIPLLKHINAGLSYADACKEMGIAQQSMTRICNRLYIDKTGTLSQKVRYTQDFKSFLVHCSTTIKNLDELATLLHTTRQRLSSCYAAAKIYVTWALEDNHNEVLSASRRAELFVKSLLQDNGFKLVQDAYTAPSEKKSHVKKRYDLIFESFGSIDAKSSICKLDPHKTPYVSFNTSGFSRDVKWCACVCFDKDRKDPIAVWMIPGSMVFGHNTLHISLNKQTKYDPYLYWSAPTFSASIDDLCSTL